MTTRRTLSRGLSTICTVAILVSACNTGSATPSIGVPSPGAATPVASSGSASDDLTWFTQAAVPYKGATIRMIGEAVPPTKVLADLAPQFTALTGIDVTVESYPFDDMMQKLNLDVTSQQGTYDVASVPYTELGRLAANKQALPLTDCLNNASLKYPGIDEQDLLEGLWKTDSYYQDQVYGFPSNPAVMMMFYRKDLFDDPGEQAAFRAKFGYDLAVPTTWEHYSDIAQFFTRKQGETLAGKTLDKDFYGVVVAGKRHKAMVEEWLNYVWSFGGDVFKADGTVTVDEQPVIDATKYFLSLFQYAPPGATDYTWDEVSTAFQQSAAAMGLHWSDQVAAVEDPEASAVAGKMGYSTPPIKAKAADSFGGYTYLVPATSKHPEAACLFLQWASSRQMDVAAAEKGSVPIRTSTFAKPEFASTPGFSATRDALSIATALPKVTQFAQVDDAIAQRISEAITKQSSVEDALHRLKADLTSILQGPQ